MIVRICWVFTLVTQHSCLSRLLFLLKVKELERGLKEQLQVETANFQQKVCLLPSKNHYLQSFLILVRTLSNQCHMTNTAKISRRIVNVLL